MNFPRTKTSLSNPENLILLPVNWSRPFWKTVSVYETVSMKKTY